MPLIQSYTPPWLSRPSPGFDLFARPGRWARPDAQQSRPAGPLRTIAHRGTEIFIAVGNEVRWADLVDVKEQWETRRGGGRGRKGADFDMDAGNASEDEEDDEENEAAAQSMNQRSGGADARRRKHRSYVTLKLPIHDEIRQLSISPAGDYLAILTSHTVHITVIPDSHHLTSGNASRPEETFKPRTFQVGPTAHVRDKARVVSALWHPLGAGVHCLVTVTADAGVRMWELDAGNRWSFDTPALALDLRKLANAPHVGAVADFTPSKYGINAGFSPDSVEMEVASATFGSSAVSAIRAMQDPWAAMTLWVAMTEGDVYALCPLVPSKLALDASYATQLSRHVALQSPSNSGADASLHRHRQRWVAALTEQQQARELERAAASLSVSVSTSFMQPQQQQTLVDRPTQPGTLPTLQGPFELSQESDDFVDITDIFVVPAASDSAPDQELDITAERSIDSAFTVVCLATAAGQVHVCVSTEDVEPRWILHNANIHGTPVKSSSSSSSELGLVQLECIKTCEPSDASWPVFTPSKRSATSVLVTHNKATVQVSVAPWLEKLSEEVVDTGTSGAEVRLASLLSGTDTSTEPLLRFSHATPEGAALPQVSACINILDSDLGDFVLTFGAGQAQAALVDDRDWAGGSLGVADSGDYMGADDNDEFGVIPGIPQESRPAYQPPQELWFDSTLLSFMQEHTTALNVKAFREQIRMSPANLKLIMDAHRVLSHETHQLGIAAADLFRRCERLQDEFAEQVKQCSRAADTIESALDSAADEYGDDNGTENEPLGVSENIDARIEQIKTRGDELAHRYTALRRKMATLDGRPLSEREASWAKEIDSVARQVDGVKDGSNGHTESAGGGDNVGEEEDDSAQPADLTSQRFTRVNALAKEMVKRAKAIPTRDEQGDSTGSPDIIGTASPSRRRNARAVEIAELLERETVLIEATKAKLDRLIQVPIRAGSPLRNV